MLRKLFGFATCAEVDKLREDILRLHLQNNALVSAIDALSFEMVLRLEGEITPQQNADYIRQVTTTLGQKLREAANA